MPTLKKKPTKSHQLVLRVSDAMMSKIEDLIRWSGFDIKRTAIIERAITELHESIRKRIAR